MSNAINNIAKVINPKRLLYRKGTTFFILLQLLLLSGLVLLVVRKTNAFVINTDALMFQLKNGTIISFIALAVLLSSINYGLEIKKWILLMPANEYVKSKFIRAFLSGCAVSVFLPFRTGEYLGRIIHFKRKEWSAVIVSSIRSGLFQLIITLLFGFIGALFILPQLLQFFPFNPFFIGLLIVFLFIATLIFIKKMDLLIPWVFKKMRLKSGGIQSSKQFAIPLMLSALRYLVFTFQYVILLHAFGIMTIGTSILIVPVFLLIQTIVPTMFLSELGLRVVLSVYLFGAAEAIIPMLFIYLINIILPALLGVFFIYKWR